MYTLEFFETTSSLEILLVSIGFGMLGACLGSYMEVVRQRGSWHQTMSGRSHCNNCQKILRWYELIPVFSYLFFKTRCSSCSTKIDFSHTASELLMGFGFGCAFFFADSLYMLFASMLVILFCVPIVINDTKYLEIPEHLSLAFMGLALITSVANALLEGIPIYTPILYGFLFASPFFLIWLVTRGKGMGLGDAKIALPLGFFLGSFSEVFSIFIFSFWIGTIFVILIWLYLFLRGYRQFKRYAEIPLAPSIVVAYFLVIWGDFLFVDLIFYLTQILH